MHMQQHANMEILHFNGEFHRTSYCILHVCTEYSVRELLHVHVITQLQQTLAELL